MCKITTSDIESKRLNELRNCLIKRLLGNIGDVGKVLIDENNLLKTIYGKEEFPQTILRKINGKKFYQIILSKSAKENDQKRFFQISHEVVHLLRLINENCSESYGKNTSCLEEGFACFNSIYEGDIFIPNFKSEQCLRENEKEKKYIKSFDSLKKIVNDENVFKDEDVFKFVRYILKEHDLSNVTKDFIKNYPNIRSEKEIEKEINFLLSKFYPPSN